MPRIKPVSEPEFLKWVADNTQDLVMALQEKGGSKAVISMQVSIAIFRKALIESGRMGRDPDLNHFTDLVASGILLGFDLLKTAKASEAPPLLVLPGDRIGDT